MGDHQQLLPQQPDVIRQNPLEAPPISSTKSPDFSVMHPGTGERRQLQSPCDNCGFSGATNGNGSGNSLKRPSPSSVNCPKPKPKKLFLDEPANYPLRRCVSDPYRPPPAQSPPDSVPGISSNNSPTPKITPNVPDSATPCSGKGSASATDCPARPPRPPTFRRCLSDLSPSPAKSFSRTSSSNDMEKTENLKKLNKIRQRWKEINTWMEEFMQVGQQSEELTESVVEEEKEEDSGVTEAHHDDANDINNATEACEPEIEESLSVEKDGKGLNIEFKCHCGKRIHFRLSDGNCFYKLT